MKTAEEISTITIMKEFWRGIRPYKWAFFVSFFCFLAGNIVNLFPALLYKDFFDVLEGASADQLIAIIINIAILHGIDWVLVRVGLHSLIFLEAKTIAQLKQNAFNYMMLHSHTFFANNFSGSLVQRVNRFSRSFERLADSLMMNILNLFVVVAGSIIITWMVAPLISLILLGWVILFLSFNIGFSIWKMKYNIAVAKADSKTTGFLADTISNQNAISLFSGYKQETDSFKRISGDQAKKTIFSWNLSNFSDSIQMFLIFAVEFFVFYFTINLWQNGEATIGTFVLIQTYIIGMSHQLWGFNRVIKNVYESLADSKEMVEIMHTPYQIKDIYRAKELSVQSGKILFSGVSFSFNSTRKVLDNVCLKINPGEKMALVGPSGIGKTTIIRLLLRMYEPDKGAIFIDGQDIQKVTQDSLHKNISLVPQDPILFHRTLMENIRYGRKDASDEEVFEAARLAHCDSFIENLSLGYDTYVGERGVKLSGGERQRIAIARAILKNAPILILDEATSSLDSESESLIQDALNNLMKGKTTIVIAHRLSTIKKMDRIIVMREGGIAEQGSHQDLLEKKGEYKKLWSLQTNRFVE